MKQLSFFLLFLSFNALSQTEPANKEIPVVVKESDWDVTDQFPFTEVFTDGDITIMAYLEGQELYEKFDLAFEKYGLKCTGTNWELVIIQLLKKKDKTLLKQLDFRSEQGGFYVDVDSGEAAKKFLDIVCPYFKDEQTLDETLESSDRSKMEK